jgi:hypothetical protein
MTIMEAITLLDNLIDESDPDIDLPNSVHAFQTAERIREAHPDKGERLTVILFAIWWKYPVNNSVDLVHISINFVPYYKDIIHIDF